MKYLVSMLLLSMLFSISAFADAKILHTCQDEPLPDQYKVTFYAESHDLDLSIMERLRGEIDFYTTVHAKLEVGSQPEPIILDCERDPRNNSNYWCSSDESTYDVSSWYEYSGDIGREYLTMIRDLTGELATIPCVTK